MSSVTSLLLNALQLDPALQLRTHVDQNVVRAYAERMKAGDAFPPVLVFADPETGEHLLVDGFHRVRAARVAQRGEIDAEVRSGTRREALLLACGLNATHGLPRSNSDKRKAATLLLEDPEWSQWSDSEIARRCGVSQPFVSRIRGELRFRRQEAERAAFRAAEEASSHNGYGLAQQKAEQVGQQTGTQVEKRKVRRKDQEYEMDVLVSGARRVPEPHLPLTAAAGVRDGRDTDGAHLLSGLPGSDTALRVHAALAADLGELPSVQPATWWRLGRQHLYCGTADAGFIRHLPRAPLALWDAREPASSGPAAGAPLVCHQWLLREVEHIAVLLPHENLFSFGLGTAAPWQRVLAAVFPSDTPLADTWLPLLLLGTAPVPSPLPTLPQLLRLSPAAVAAGAQAVEITVALLEQLTPEGAPVIDPALGHGATLLAAEATGRICWGAEADAVACGRIIRAWEALTGETAEPGPVYTRPAA